jgi:hypothetical protein
VARLRFKKAYIEPIIRGDKRSTLRARKPSFAVGDTFLADCRGEGIFAKLRCTAVEFVDAESFTDEMAHDDGFQTVEELRSVLARLYPGERWFWRISFERDVLEGGGG